MTELLEKAFAAASQLPAHEQDAVASLILSELEADKQWEAVLAKEPDKLRRLAQEAGRDFDAGRTNELNVDEI